MSRNRTIMKKVELFHIKGDSGILRLRSGQAPSGMTEEPETTSELRR